jgi:hypothetical protein
LNVHSNGTKLSYPISLCTNAINSFSDVDQCCDAGRINLSDVYEGAQVNAVMERISPPSPILSSFVQDQAARYNIKITHHPYFIRLLIRSWPNQDTYTYSEELFVLGIIRLGSKLSKTFRRGVLSDNVTLRVRSRCLRNQHLEVPE